MNKIPALGENEFYYEYTNKIFSDSGVSHDIDPECFFIDGMKFVFEGNFKITDENRDPLSCYWDVHKVGHVRACPVVSFRVYLPSGSIVVDNVYVKLYEKNCYNRLSVSDDKVCKILH